MEGSLPARVIESYQGCFAKIDRQLLGNSALLIRGEVFGYPYQSRRIGRLSCGSRTPSGQR